MNKTARLFLGLAICVFGVFGESLFDRFVKENKPKEVEVVKEPSLELKTLVEPIVKIEISKEDADFIKCFYEEMADVLSQDNEFVKTTSQFREFNIASGKLYFPAKLKNKYETLGESIDSALMASLGKESSAMSADKRQKAVDVLKAIAWGVNQ